jgi:hypothetical protein
MRALLHSVSLFALVALLIPPSLALECNVVDYGAKGDGAL